MLNLVCKLGILTLIQFLSLLFVKCDLPIHTLTKDVIGVWRISETSLNDNFQNCGSTNPNKNLENLKIDNFKLYLQEIYGNLNEFVIELSNERSYRHNLPYPRNKWSYLSVKDVHSNQIIGYWTLVYDEGIMIDIDNKNYFGYFKYNHVNSNECKRLTGDVNEDSFGNIKCYETDPSKLQIGWFSKRDKNNFKFGCFYIQKLYNTNNNNSKSINNDNPNYANNTWNGKNNNANNPWNGKNYTVDLTSLYYNSNIFKPFNISNMSNASVGTNYSHLTPFRFTQISKGNFYYPLHASDDMVKGNSPPFLDLMNKDNSPPFLDNWNKDNNPPYTIDNFNKVNNPLGHIDHIIKDNNPLHSIYPCDLNQRVCDNSFDMSKLPKNWTWGDPYNGIEEDIYTSGQGNCGSCYILSSMYVISKRFQILFNKLKPNKNYKLNQFILNQNDLLKSTFNQGCYGGFLMAVGKHGKELGISSMHSDHKFYLSNYGYVGGCYECTNERNMMIEIYTNGPISTSIYLPNNFNFNTNEIFNVNYKHGMICDVPNNNLNGWEFVNHSIVIVGWGESIENGKKVKFWICKNTWGRDWGNEGFFKLKKGDNILGVESQATYFDPDLSRGLSLLM